MVIYLCKRLLVIDNIHTYLYSAEGRHSSLGNSFINVYIYSKRSKIVILIRTRNIHGLFILYKLRKLN